MEGGVGCCGTFSSVWMLIGDPIHRSPPTSTEQEALTATKSLSSAVGGRPASMACDNDTAVIASYDQSACCRRRRRPLGCAPPTKLSEPVMSAKQLLKLYCANSVLSSTISIWACSSACSAPILGDGDGCGVGGRLGAGDGCGVGAGVGDGLGSLDGPGDGGLVGLPVGCGEGRPVGLLLGGSDVPGDGWPVGGPETEISMSVSRLRCCSCVRLDSASIISHWLTGW
eukprot:scaffold143_cov260-Pinguiococcus_pyrenoidosus.AAC.15